MNIAINLPESIVAHALSTAAINHQTFDEYIKALILRDTQSSEVCAAQPSVAPEVSSLVAVLMEHPIGASPVTVEDLYKSLGPNVTKWSALSTNSRKALGREFAAAARASFEAAEIGNFCIVRTGRTVQNKGLYALRVK